MATALTYGPMERSMSVNLKITIDGVAPLTTPMELSQEPTQTVNGLPNNQPNIAEKAERFTVLVGC